LVENQAVFSVHRWRVPSPQGLAVERKVQPHRAASASLKPAKPDWRPGVGCNGLFGLARFISIDNSRGSIFVFFLSADSGYLVSPAY